MPVLRGGLIAALVGVMLAAYQLLPFVMGLDVASLDMTFYWNVIHDHYLRGGSLWFDRILNGASLLANPLYGLFYWPNGLYRAFPDQGMRLLVLFHYAVLASGSAVWLGLAGRRPLARIVASLLLVVSGVVLSLSFRGLPYLFAFCWLPWIAALGVGAARGSPLLAALAAGGLGGTAFVAGDVQLAVYAPLAYVAGFWDGARSQGRFGATWRSIAGSVPAACLGFLASSGVVLYQTAAAFTLSHRAGGLKPYEVLRFSEHPARWIEAFVKVYGDPNAPGYAAASMTSSILGTQWWHASIYFGPAAAVVLVAGIAKAWRRQEFWGYLGVAFLGLFWSTGLWNPVVSWLVENVWQLRLVRYPSKAFLPGLLALLPVVALGIEWLEDRLKARLPAHSAQAGLGFAVAILIIPPLVQSTPFRYLDDGWRRPPAVLAAVADRPGSPARLIVEGKVSSAGLSVHDAMMIWGGVLPWGYRTYWSVDAITNPELSQSVPVEDFAAAEARSNFGVTNILVVPPLHPQMDAALAAGELKVLARNEQDGVTMLGETKPTPRHALLSRWASEPLQNPSLFEGRAFVSSRHHLTGSGSLAPGPVPETLASQGCEGPVAAADYSPDAERASFDTYASCPTLLGVNLNFVPGWRATVDGAEVAIANVNDLMLGIPLPAGKHKVELRFDPPFSRGWIQVMIALQVAAAALTVWLVTRKAPR